MICLRTSHGRSGGTDCASGVVVLIWSVYSVGLAGNPTSRVVRVGDCCIDARSCYDSTVCVVEIIVACYCRIAISCMTKTVESIVCEYCTGILLVDFLDKVSIVIIKVGLD